MVKQKPAIGRYNLVSPDLQQAVFESIMSNSPVAFVYIDMEGDVITCNPAFEGLFGYSLDELQGHNIDDFISRTDNLEEARALTLRATQNSEILRMNITRYHRDGSIVELESQGIPVIENGKTVGVLAQYHDVTHLKNAERVSNNLYKSFKLLMDSIDTDVYVSDMETYDILFANKHMESFFGKDLIGKKCHYLFRKTDSPCPHCTNNQLLNPDGTPSPGVIWEGFNPISKRWYKNSDRAVYWVDNRLVRLQIATDITDLKDSEKVLAHMATHDSLTGLPNRTLFQDRLQQAIKFASREKIRFAVMFLDLDKFKMVNDSYGHHAGDLVLKEVSSRLKECLRESDTIARVSGDEFTLLLERVVSISEVESIASRIVESIKTPISYEDYNILVSASIGISIYPDMGVDMDTLINSADHAMYSAKASGGSQHVIFGN